MPEREEKTGNNSDLGMYLHVPFCSTTCDFCAFYQERPSKKGFDLFFNGLEKEVERFPANHSFSTVFIGGGTPGLLKVEQIKRLGDIINSQDLQEDAECSMEVAPSEITSKKLEAISEIGINRISLGVQTFDSGLMSELGRMHEVSKAVDAFQMIREIGFRSVNLDLIFGAPGQTLEQWENDMIRAIELQPDHLSTYCLTFEEDTALYVKMAKGKIRLDSEKEASFYEKAWDFLPRHGYKQYEISNFAKPGFACRHNLNTWRMNEWLGYGPSACSQYQGVRRKNLSNLEHWSTQLNDNLEIEYQEYQNLSKFELARDAVLFGLRLNEGVDLKILAKNFSLPLTAFDPVASFFLNLGKEGLCESKKGKVSLTPKGRILADAVAKDLPELSSVLIREKSTPEKQQAFG